MAHIINIADIASKSILTITDLNGVKHEMKAATVQSFIDNVKLIESMGVNASAADEMEAMIKVILGAFPTLDDANVRGWPLEALQQISDLARGQNGEIATADEAAAEESKETGNAPTKE